MRFEGLLRADRGEVRISPGGSLVAFEERPIAVPCRSTVEGFGDVVVTLAMAAGEDDLVLDVMGGLLVEVGDVIGKALPLRLLVVWIVG